MVAIPTEVIPMATALEQVVVGFRKVVEEAVPSVEVEADAGDNTS